MPRRFLTWCAGLLACLLSMAAFASTKKPPLRPININTATSNELQLVPGIGPATAEKILTMRKSYGPFKSVDDLLAIKGLGRKRLDKMRKYLTVGKPAPPDKSGAFPAKAATPAKNSAKPQVPPQKSDVPESSESPQEPPRA